MTRAIPMLLVGASLTLESLFPLCSDFLQRIGVKADGSLEKQVTKSILQPEDQQATIIVQDLYVLTYSRGEIMAFHYKNRPFAIHSMLTRLDPAEMKAWSEQPSLLDEKQARDLALDYFRKLGFKDEDYEPPQCNRYQWQPSEHAMERVLLLPAFHVKWLKKGVKENEYEFGDKVVIAVSGTDKRLLYYFKGKT